MDFQQTGRESLGRDGAGGYFGDERRVRPDEDYFNAQFAASPLYLTPGHALCSDSEADMLVATVGAGVLLSMFDTDLMAGALAYTLLPRPLVDQFPRFDDADPHLMEIAFQPVIECIGEMKRRGAGKGRLRIRLMGGAHLAGDDKDAGTKTYIFVREYLGRKGLSVMNEDIGGPHIRRVHFFPTTGRAVRLVLKRAGDLDTVQGMEGVYQKGFAV